MKILIILLTVAFGFSNAFAQDKEDNIWILGYNPNDSLAGFGGTRLNFINNTVQVSYFPITVDAGNPGNTAEICSPDGDFLFFSNGCKIINDAGLLISNGDEINPGTLHDLWCNPGDHAYHTYQGPIALPWPGRPGEYVMFHLGWYQTSNWPPSRYIRDFYATRIDMNANNGLGEVLEKNTILLQDSNLVDNLTAVRHGNGRDWWLVEPRGLSDTFYLFLITPNGIKGPFIEKTGLRSDALGFTAGQVVFSPDGTRYVRVNREGVDIFDFDRCRGQFICGKRIPHPGIPDAGISGAAISPSSRYLYISALTKLFQYDLQANNIEASKILLGEYDGFKDPLATTFYQQMLAPNGKIYMTAANGTQYMHVINYPDSAGLACGFQQHGLKLATKHGFCVPNLPHFRLYDLPASPCDSLGIDAPEEYRVLWSPSDAIRLFPNPVGTGTVTITIPPCAGGWVRIFNAAGQILKEYKIDQERFYSLDCSDLPNGVYVVTFSTLESKRPMVARLVVCR